mmetsp:Transcript_17956/g.61208  ORF Transcript_17956/g.61208 Transcript_17956/m.61208 type:complete len:297 (-) Transcript_17956:68-958(-)
MTPLTALLRRMSPSRPCTLLRTLNETCLLGVDGPSHLCSRACAALSLFLVLRTSSLRMKSFAASLTASHSSSSKSYVPQQTCVSLLNGMNPDKSTYAVTPTAHMSTAGGYSASSSTSGAQNSGVPHTLSCTSSPTKRLRPKSSSFAAPPCSPPPPASTYITLSGFTSLCTRPTRCISPRPSTIWRTSAAASFSVYGWSPCAIRSIALPPCSASSTTSTSPVAGRSTTSSIWHMWSWDASAARWRITRTSWSTSARVITPASSLGEIRFIATEAPVAVSLAAYTTAKPPRPSSAPTS